MGVVTCGNEKAAVGTELDTAGVVTAFTPLFSKTQEDFLTGQVENVAFHFKATEPLTFDGSRRVIQVDPMIVRELRVERESQQAVLLVGCCLHRASLGDGFRIRFPDPHFTADLDKKDPPVRGDFQFHRLRHSCRQHFGFVAGIGRRGFLRGQSQQRHKVAKRRE